MDLSEYVKWISDISNNKWWVKTREHMLKLRLVFFPSPPHCSTPLNSPLRLSRAIPPLLAARLIRLQFVLLSSRFTLVWCYVGCCVVICAAASSVWPPWKHLEYKYNKCTVKTFPVSVLTTSQVFLIQYRVYIKYAVKRVSTKKGQLNKRKVAQFSIFRSTVQLSSGLRLSRLSFQLFSGSSSCCKINLHLHSPILPSP